MHLAQLNVARLKYPFEDPCVAEFADNLDLVNGIAERSEGFVWRFMDDAAGNATDIRAFDDPMVIVNMSVWRDPEHLERFVWNTIHKRIYARKAEWFAAMESHHFVIWFVEEGHTPTLAEAKERLAHLDAHGNTDFAFDWGHLEHVKLWQSQRCG